MKRMNTNELREAFIAFFESKSHRRVASSSLVPGNDPTLLFTNAGMVPFKDVFLGHEQRSYQTATSSQRCVRAGGKHNDLDNVGYTRRHHTFFEMLGNFSFGDYFKREAIQFAWEFLTKVLEVPAEKLWVTVYKDDKESESIWLNEMKIDVDRFSRCGEKDNFWSMGEVGPCGPCTEIFYDHGEDIAGGPPGSVDEDGDRYVEIWNLVFMQYNRDSKGELHLLPNPCVDTGMGLERIAAVLQGVHDNYDTDSFQTILSAVSQVANISDFTNTSLRVIADHIRSVCFLISDGVTPANEGRGYVLRRIIRRALRHGYRLGINDVFLSQLVSVVVSLYQDIYPELVSNQSQIEAVISQEEAQFARTLTKGMKVLEQEIEKLETSVIPGYVAFLLYDTYGFPFDLTADIARERGLSVDSDGFDVAMAEQRTQSQRSQQFTMEQTQQIHIDGETAFLGYDCLESSATVTTLLHDHLPVSVLHAGEAGVVVLDQTPFYPEGGGQVGDHGFIRAESGACFEVFNTQKLGASILHVGRVVEGLISSGDVVVAQVDDKRLSTRLNHSATHLLHAALRHLLGPHVIQKGSLVDPEHLRFDFSHAKALTLAQLQAIESAVNAAIRDNLPVSDEQMALEAAQEQGAMALFGEKYTEQVRVITMGDYSIELCGGTHVERTGDIGCFVIVSESACASGVRRIDALTGRKAIEFIQKKRRVLTEVAEYCHVDTSRVADKVAKLHQQNKALTKELAQLKKQLAGDQSSDLTEAVSDVNGIAVLAQSVPGLDREGLRASLDAMRSRYTSYAFVLASVQEGNILLVASVSKDLHQRMTAGALLKNVATQVGGKGGGRPDFAQGGGTLPDQLPDALASVSEWVMTQSEAS